MPHCTRPVTLDRSQTIKVVKVIIGCIDMKISNSTCGRYGAMVACMPTQPMDLRYAMLQSSLLRTLEKCWPSKFSVALPRVLSLVS